MSLCTYILYLLHSYQKQHLGCINSSLHILSDDQVDCGIHLHWLCVIIEYDSTKFDGECLFRRTIRLLSPWQICRPILLILQGRCNLFGFPKKHLIKFHIND